MSPALLRRPFVALALVAALAACDSPEERAEEYYESALALLEDGDTDRALIELRNVFELVPGHREARTTYARAVMREGRTNEAYRQYLRLVEQYPDDLEGRRILTEIAFLRADWQEVDRHGAVVIEKAMDDPRVQAIDIGRRYRDTVLAEDAEARRAVVVEAQALLDQLPESQILRRVLIDGYRLDAEYGRVLELIDSLIAEDPDEQDLYNQRLAILASMADEPGIERQLLEMVERFPKDDNIKSTLIRFYVSRDERDKAEAFLRDISDPADDESTHFLSLVQFIAQTRGTDAARAELQRGIEINPGSVTYPMVLAGYDFAEGNRDEAVAAMRALIDGAAESSDQIRQAKIALARMLVSTGNEVGARRLVEEVLEEDATNVAGLKMQAAWLIDADDTDGAVNSLRAALDEEPEDAQAMTLMAQAYTRAGSHELARDFLALAVDASGNAPAESIRYATQLIEEERFLPAEDILIPALRLAPGNVDLLSLLGQLYLRMEDEPRATQVIGTLRRLDTDRARGEANEIEANLLNQQDGIGAASQFLESLAEGEDANVAAQLAVLQARLASGEVESARSYIDELVEGDPENPVLRYAAASTRAATGDLDAAISGYRALLSENSARPVVWLELARVLRAAGQPEAAAAAVDDGLASQPESPRLLWAKATLLERGQDIEGAISIYEGLYERLSNSSVVANNLASLLATYRADDESLERAWRVARRLRDSDLPPFQDTYGWIAFRKGDPEEALRYMEPAARGLPEDPIVQYHLARVYQELGQNAEALAQYQRAIEVAGPGDTRDQISDARARIQALREAASDQ
ncbi:tetratricopeptide repeat protein [uncultured Roseobacter sp.]|uniref:tetratricopeptide repeat protein n=1 Tax=uncultured Roseobacter sp. TaxID=114847 RepID=UPI002610A256|nr:tetratricopeptide repeat protein [uncultured Roseobacter sp.]